MRKIDLFKYETKYTKSLINAAKDNLKVYIVEVVSVEGPTLTAKFNTGEVLENIEGIPILQNKYFTQIIKQGDTGLIINLHNGIGELYKGLNENDLGSKDFYVFIPFGLEEAISEEYNGEAFTWMSADSNTTMKLGDQSLEVNTDGDIVVNADNSINVESNEIGVKGDTQVKIEAPTTIIKGTEPVEIGAADTLGSLLTELVNMLASAMTGPLAPSGATTSFDASTIANLTSLATKISSSFK